MSKTCCRLIFAASVALAAAQTAAAEVPARAVPIEVWAVSHDELTDRLSAAISIALNDSPGFAASIGKKPGSLYVTIADRVHWKIMGDRAQLTAPVTIADQPPNARPLLLRTVSCRDDHLLECGGQVVGFAKSVAQRGQAKTVSAARQPVRALTQTAER